MREGARGAGLCRRGADSALRRARRRGRPFTAAIALFLLSMVGVACGGGKVRVRPRAMPVDGTARSEAAEAFARELFDALRRAGAAAAVSDGAVLDAVLTPAARARVEVERAVRGPSGAPGPWAGPWAEYAYHGFCAQGAREAPAGGALGLRAAAWVMDRLLVIAAHGPQRSAAWVDGTFVFTNEGWKAISITRVEAPRAGHSDLELAPCDVQKGLP